MKRIRQEMNDLKQYGFTDKLGHPLENCAEFQDLQARIEKLEKALRKIEECDDVDLCRQMAGEALNP